MRKKLGLFHQDFSATKIPIKSTLLSDRHSGRDNIRHSDGYSDGYSDRHNARNSDRASADLRICTRVRSSLWWKHAKTIIAFKPLRDEPNILPLLKNTRKHVVMLPQNFSRLQVSTSILDQLNDLRACKLRFCEQPYLLLVPGMCFSTRLQRLGRGAGVYDALITLLRFSTVCICLGICYDLQITTELVTESHDSSVHAIITDRSLYK